MATKATIEWTEMTWNPATGCTKVSEGCRHCYAERMALRLRAMGNRRYANGFRVTLHDDVVDLPRQLRLPRSAHEARMSGVDPEAMPTGQGRLFLQAMGRHQEGHYGPRTERPDLR
jgi:protein gp37